MYVWKAVAARGRHDEAKLKMMFVLFVNFVLFAIYNRG